MSDLFGHESVHDRLGAMTDAERRRMRRRAYSVPRGHAMPPGTGPEGETCGSCRHLVRNRMAKTYLKCGRNEAAWTGGPKSDVRARDAACGKWEPADTHTTTGAGR